MPLKNECVTLEIDGMTHEGSGVGHLDGMAVFVPAAAVGDTVLIRIVKVQKNCCYGKIEKIVKASEDRIPEDCAVARRCGGCVFRHVSYAAELRYKQDFVEQNMRRIGGFHALCCEPIMPSPTLEGYRNKAQYPIRLQKNGLCAGFFAPRTHEVVDCRDCKLQPVSFSRILETVLWYVREQRVPVYDEQTGTGLLRHLYLRQGTRSQEIMVCFVLNGHTLPAADVLINALLQCEEKIVSIVLNENTKNTNVILGDKTRVLYGKSAIADTLCDIAVQLSPEAFYQVNSPAAEQLYAVAAEYAGLTGAEILLDLYCGTGTIGLSMAHQVKEVIGVELVFEAVENARRNAADNQIKNARFFCADAGQAAMRLAAEGVRPDVVVLDPPRKGCSADVLKAVAQMGPQRIVYISCNSATLARDCAAFGSLGYTVSRCRPADLFPRTAHVETVVLLQKTFMVDSLMKKRGFNG